MKDWKHVQDKKSDDGSYERMDSKAYIMYPPINSGRYDLTPKKTQNLKQEKQPSPNIKVQN